MIDPAKITNYNLTDEQLEEHILFWICAAGKNGMTAAKCLNNFLTDKRLKYGIKHSPFEIVKKMDQKELVSGLRKAGIGCYNLKAETFRSIADSNLNLKTCSVNDLENIKGIGCKTSRCFIIHSRPNQKLAGLDRHILSWLRDKGYDVPKSTPTGQKYKQIENIFIKEAEKTGKDIATLDLEIWNEYRDNK